MDRGAFIPQAAWSPLFAMEDDMAFWAASSAPRHCLSSRDYIEKRVVSMASSRNLRRPALDSRPSHGCPPAPIFRPTPSRSNGVLVRNPNREIGACDEHLRDDHVKSIGQDARFPGHFYGCACCSDKRNNNCGTVRPSFNLTIDAIGTIGGCCRRARGLER